MAQKIVQKSKSSTEYWRKREEENLKKNLLTEEEYVRHIHDILDYTADQIQREINGFYTRYARQEGISLAEAKRRIKSADVEEFARKAKKYVKEKDFSKQANEEMRLYNATMKINRLELLKANIGLELVSGFDELQKYNEEILTDRTKEELERQAGILGGTVQNNEKMVSSIVNGSFHNATYSERIWLYQDMMKNELDKLLRQGLIQGKNPRQLATHLQKLFGTCKYVAERLMRTELARVQIDAQKQSFEKNGYEQYTFLSLGSACGSCRSLNGKHFEVSKMMPGDNAPPIHPNCRCSVAAHMDDESYNEWLDTYKEHGLDFETWKQLYEEEVYESDIGQRLMKRITGVSKQKKDFEKRVESIPNEDVKALLKQSLSRIEIVRSREDRSHYSKKEKKVYLSKDARPNTIAHELFHEIDSTYGLVENGMLKNSVRKDYRRLQNQAKAYGKSIEEMLYLKYPEAFETNKYGIKFKEEYRGISDILNGMSNGRIKAGYFHDDDYWKRSGQLEKESWAQYGRMFYMDGKALEMARIIFPEMSEEIEQRIRRMIK